MFAQQNNILQIPLGYTSGLKSSSAPLAYKKAARRKYPWTFIGQIRGKPSRPHMKEVLQREVEGGYLYESDSFEEGMQRAVDHAADKIRVLNDTVFTLCP
jgi:hypothetical protein